MALSMCNAASSRAPVASRFANNQVFVRRQSASSRKAPLRVTAIGFDLAGASPERSAARQAEELTRQAASILLYQSVLKSKPAKAFLGLLFHLQKGTPVQVLESYGEFYKAMAVDGQQSWADCVVEKILHDAGPFAKAAAKLDDPTVERLFPAVQSDLDCLQALAVSELRLSTWIQEAVGGELSTSWLTAARSSSAFSDDDAQDVELLAVAPSAVLAPLSAQQRAALRAAIRSEGGRWGKSAKALQRYHAAHDYGLVSMHSVLKWAGDRLQAQDVLAGVGGVGAPGEASWAIIEELSSDFFTLDVGDRSAGHSPICKAAGREFTFAEAASATTFGLQLQRAEDAGEWWVRLQEQHGAAEMKAAWAGLRTVILPAAHRGEIAELAWTLSLHPRVRFAVICPGNIAGKPDVGAVVHGQDGFSWPANAVFLECRNELEK